MADALPLIAAWVAGAALGILFFGGLWWTVPRGIASPRPALWFGASLLLRVGPYWAGSIWSDGATGRGWRPAWWDLSC